MPTAAEAEDGAAEAAEGVAEAAATTAGRETGSAPAAATTASRRASSATAAKPPSPRAPAVVAAMTAEAGEATKGAEEATEEEAAAATRAAAATKVAAAAAATTADPETGRCRWRFHLTSPPPPAPPRKALKQGGRAVFTRRRVSRPILLFACECFSRSPSPHTLKSKIFSWGSAPLFFVASNGTENLKITLSCVTDALPFFFCPRHMHARACAMCLCVFSLG